ncbi:glycoside hydrolase family 127 protein [Streptomyces sedi]|uniref:Glycoside hydrolase family 127 protein n=1 Tax=Streptomyces sedi TaxID=555059 RepID=A0A5C4UXY0_9ACTN|nr:beta-L-arabinofuranosidase domain-containing protein [Streptomyces sedi]TNM28417.1 glycoside hydrolase family 127 protein [Streptomyces sedi]
MPQTETARNETPLAAPADPRGAPGARLSPVPLGAATLTGGPLAEARERNRTITLETIHRRCEECGAIDNLRRAGGLLAGDPVADFQGAFYADSDVHKWLEAACWQLAETPEDDALRARVDEVVAVLEAAQGEDGYLNSYFMGERAARRWTNLRDEHEMYCGGHLVQAAVAHFRATGERRLLAVAERFAAHVWSVFGPGRRPGADGHPGYETALVELARATGDPRYAEQALWFVEQHGATPPAIGGRAYHLDHEPLAAQREVVGHAVRALYLYTGATDLLTELPESAASLDPAVDALWRDFTDRKRYVTGGGGARHDGEAFGAAWELDDERAYAESCASVAHFQWAWRMLLRSGVGAGGGAGELRDAMEQVLHNGLLSGVGLDGEHFFYVNPLADNGGHRRSPWFGTACCPPNLARLVAALPAYAYAVDSVDPATLWVLLLAEGRVRAEVAGGTLELAVTTAYPWEGGVRVEVVRAPEGECGIALPAPGWADAPVEWAVDGVGVAGEAVDGFTVLRRRWRAGEVVSGVYPLAVRPVVAHPWVRAAHGRTALARGPLVFCLEQADHPGVDVRDIAVAGGAGAEGWEAEWRPELLGGTVVLRGEGLARPAPAPDAPLYRSAGAREVGERERVAWERVALTAVPYRLWANREAGPMQVWLPEV